MNSYTKNIPAEGRKCKKKMRSRDEVENRVPLFLLWKNNKKNERV